MSPHGLQAAAVSAPPWGTVATTLFRDTETVEWFERSLNRHMLAVWRRPLYFYTLTLITCVPVIKCKLCGQWIVVQIEIIHEGEQYYT